MRKILLTLALSLVSYASPSLTVDDLISLALRHSPDLTLARLDVADARAQGQSARSFYLPSLNLHLGAGKEHDRFRAGAHQSVDLLAGTLSASQILYDFGKRSARVAAIDEETLARLAQMHQRISDRILGIKQIYYEILKVKGNVQVQEKNLLLQREQLRRARRYLEAGIRTVVDLSNAQVRLEQAKLSLQNARFRLRLLRSQLEESLGTVPRGGKYHLYTPRLDLKGLAKRLPAVRTPLSQLERYAQSHRALLKAGTHRLKSAEHQIRSTRAGYFPTLTLDASHTLNKVDDALATTLPKSQSTLSINLQWNLFSGFRTRADLERSRIAMMQADARNRQQRLAIRREVQEAYLNLQQSRQNVLLNDRISQRARTKYRQSKKRYENGLADFLELQNAQQDYIDALTRLVNSYYDAYIALSTLDHAIGR